MPDSTDEKKNMSPLDTMRKKLQDAKNNDQSHNKNFNAFNEESIHEFFPHFTVVPQDATKAVQQPEAYLLNYPNRRSSNPGTQSKDSVPGNHRKNPLSLAFNRNDTDTLPIKNGRIQTDNKSRQNPLSALKIPIDRIYFKAAGPDSSQNNIPGFNKSVNQHRSKLTKRKKDFYNEVAPKIIQGAANKGISAKNAYFILAQRLLENGWRSSVPGNNPFNLKGVSKDGKSVLLHTKEQDKKGNIYNIVAKFRAYDSIDDGTKDFLSNIEQKWPEAYKALTDNNSNVDDFVNGLNSGKPGGYATDQKYKEKLKALYSQILKDLE
jgi:flagellum-specific peptidoglycan hydrolase FlgJ